MRVLVTGGAGYVGSIVTEELLAQGHEAVVLDSLQQGHRQAVPPGARLIVADICQPEAVDKALSQAHFDAVMHMAAETVIEYSMTDPKRFFHKNVCGGINVLDGMLKHGVAKLIFSSTAAVYGEPQRVPIDENHPKKPLNAYGESKLMFEQILRWYEMAYGMKHICLRYFNAAGASQRLGEDHQPETHLIPNVLAAAANGNKPVPIFGSDYPTPDGSCVRDYVHVRDIAQAHILALDKVEDLSGGCYNLGNNKGYSVLEVVAAARRVTGREIPLKLCPKRAGDPAVLVASSNQAQAELGWRPQTPDLEGIIGSAWNWLKEHPGRYA